MPTFYYKHRYRLLEMTVGARFPATPSPSPSPLLSFLPPSLPSHPTCHSCHPFIPSPLSLSLPFPSLYPQPLNPAKGSGGPLSSPSGSGWNLATKRFWCIFRLKSTQLFQFHNDTFVIFTVPFGCGQRWHNKISVGATWGHRPHGVGTYDYK